MPLFVWFVRSNHFQFWFLLFIYYVVLFKLRYSDVPIWNDILCIALFFLLNSSDIIARRRTFLRLSISTLLLASLLNPQEVITIIWYFWLNIEDFRINAFPHIRFYWSFQFFLPRFTEVLKNLCYAFQSLFRMLSMSSDDFNLTSSCVWDH